MGVMLAATDSLNWLARITDKSPAELTEALGDTLLAPGRLRFLPYLSGERTPHNDASIRGSFTGLSASSTREDMTRAVLEGVAFGIRDSFEALQATGADLKQVVAIGGDPDVLMTPPGISETIEPERDQYVVFDQAYRAFRSTYPAIKEIQ